MALNNDDRDDIGLEDLDWQRAIEALLKLGDVTLPKNITKETFDIVESYPFLNDGLPKIKGFSKLMFTNTSFPHLADESDFMEAVYRISDPLERALELELVIKKEDQIFARGSGMFKCYSLTAKGLDVALKLQEHADNERRHSITASYSKKAFGVSVTALVFAAISVTFNYLRLDLYEKQVNKIEANQAAIIKKADLENVRGFQTY